MKESTSALESNRRVHTIDWNQIHVRLQTVQAAIERKVAPSVEEKRNILVQRAKTLAREHPTEAASGTSLEILEFLLAHERYGIELSHVQEVYPFKELTVLPGVPNFVRGVINVRGKILSIIDIKTFFDLPQKGLTDLNKVIILHTASVELGLLADAVIGVRQIPVQEIQPSLPTLSGIRTEYLRGVTQERLVIIDARKVLLDKKLSLHGDVEITT